MAEFFWFAVKAYFVVGAVVAFGRFLKNRLILQETSIVLKRDLNMDTAGNGWLLFFTFLFQMCIWPWVLTTPLAMLRANDVEAYTDETGVVKIRERAAPKRESE